MKHDISTSIVTKEEQNTSIVEDKNLINHTIETNQIDKPEVLEANKVDESEAFETNQVYEPEILETLDKELEVSFYPLQTIMYLYRMQILKKFLKFSIVSHALNVHFQVHDEIKSLI